MLNWQWNVDEAQAAWKNKGRELGRIEGIEIVVMNMLKNGNSIEEIQKATKLSSQRIEELAKSN